MKNAKLFKAFNQPFSSKGKLLESVSRSLSHGILIPEEDKVHSTMFLYSLLIPVNSADLYVGKAFFSPSTMTSGAVINYGIDLFKGDLLEISFDHKGESFMMAMDLSGSESYKQARWFFEKELDILSTGNFTNFCIKLRSHGIMRTKALDHYSFRRENNGIEKYKKHKERIITRLSSLSVEYYHAVDFLPDYENLLSFVQSHEGDLSSNLQKYLKIDRIKDAEELNAIESLFNSPTLSSWKKRLNPFYEERDQGLLVLEKVAAWEANYKEFKGLKPI